MTGWNWLYPQAISDWHVVAVADFNGDTVPDIVWMKDDTRQVTVHYFGGSDRATMTGWNWLNPNGVPGWHVVCALDFNGDGTPDLVWYNDTTTQLTVHYYHGTHKPVVSAHSSLLGHVVGPDAPRAAHH